MIKSFADKTTAALFLRKKVKRLPPDIQKRALVKLAMIHHAQVLEDLKVPPANRLEALKGDRQGQHSIRINNQWRICFRWQDNDAFDVEITDYH